MLTKITIDALLATRGYLREADLASRPGKRNPLQVLPISRATLWRWVKSGRFPKPIHLSPGVSAWPTETVLNWLHEHSQDVENSL